MMMSLAEQIAKAQCAFALRRKCSLQWMKSGTLDAGDAQYQLCGMEAIVQTLMRLDAAPAFLIWEPGVGSFITCT